MSKDNTKHIRTYNVTIEHDPTTTTTNEQRAMLLFSIEALNRTYADAVGDHCVDTREYVTR